MCFDGYCPVGRKERRDVFVHAVNFPQILGIGNYCVIPIQL